MVELMVPSWCMKERVLTSVVRLMRGVLSSK